MRILTKNKSRSKVIAITAGGTGGHIFPALTIARMFLQEGYRVLFYTDKKFFNYIKSEDVIFRSEMIKLIQLKAKNTFLIEKHLTSKYAKWLVEYNKQKRATY